MKHTITRDQIVQHEVCDEVLPDFDAAYPDGELVYDPTSAEDAARILGGPLAPWWSWAVDSGVAVPFCVAAGNFGAATSGNFGAATSGYWGTSTSGYRGTSTSGEWGTSTSGHRGASTSGDWGTSTSGNFGASTSGYRGTSTSGYRGTSTSGEWGTLVLAQQDGRRRRLIVGYIGETTDAAGEVLAPRVAYRLDEEGRFVRA